jgi:hypothetical protein
MKRFTCAGIVSLVFLASAGPADASYSIYTVESLFIAALTNSRTIDFENYTLSGGSHVSITGTEYSSSGVTFSSPMSHPLWVESAPPYNPYYDSNFLSIDEEPGEAWDWNNDDSMDFSLTVPAYAFGVSLVDNSGGPGEFIHVYGTSTLLYSQVGLGADFFGIVSDEQIGHILFNEAYRDQDDIGYDNVIIGNVADSAEVPEPASVTLMGLLIAGAAGLGLRRRSRFPSTQ